MGLRPAPTIASAQKFLTYKFTGFLTDAKRTFRAHLVDILRVDEIDKFHFEQCNLDSVPNNNYLQFGTSHYRKKHTVTAAALVSLFILY